MKFILVAAFFLVSGGLLLHEYDQMKHPDPSTDKLFGQILKTERKIEATAIDRPKPGYIENMFGSYDREDLTQELLQRYAELMVRWPDDKDLKYQYAGALARAKKYDDAAAAYSELLDSSTMAHLMLAMIELDRGNRAAAETRLAIYNQRCVNEGKPFMQSSLEKIAMKKNQPL